MSTLTLSTHSASSFRALLKENLTPYREREIANSFIIGIAEQLDVLYSKYLLFSVSDESHCLISAFLMTPPHFMAVCNISEERKEESFEVLTRHFLSSSLSLPGVFGPSTSTDVFVKIWQKHTNESYRIAMSERLYHLPLLHLPSSLPPGLFRVAEPKDEGWLVESKIDFYNEATPDFPHFSREEVEKHVREGVEKKNLYVWENDGVLCSFAALNRMTPLTLSIGPVFTSFSFRKFGFGSATTALLCQEVIEKRGKIPVLFADLANEISNGMYTKIGFVKTCDYIAYRFEKPHSADPEKE